jgi:cytochrome c oxidase assembly factor CtaG
MTEHVGVLMVAPLLFALGLPLSGVLRRWVCAHWPHAFTLVLVVHTVVTIGWHLPAPFDAAVRAEPLHGVEHLSMFAAGYGFWSVLFARRNIGASLVPLLFVASLPGMALGLTMMLSEHVWYATAPNSVVDQQLGGVVMLALGGAVFATVALVGFARWMLSLPPTEAVLR